ncbi:MAG: DUF4007 family protein [Cyanobacteria bacterium P01_G01_bin.49]
MTVIPLNMSETRPSVNLVFARHETFHPRYGWLKKGFDLATNYPGIFTAENAPVRLGVGKNMVKSIRYWCNAFKVLENDRPSDFGKQLLSNKGYDPFLENPASLWLLHWNLLKPTCDAAAWYYTFNLFRSVEFYAEDLSSGLRSYQETSSKATAESSLKKDINCILRMYVQQKATKGLIEDSIDCPFSELGLIHTAGELKRYTFRVGTKATLSPDIIVAACLDYASRVSYGTKTLALSRLLYDVGSPGMVFKLTEEALCDAIERVARYNNQVALSDTAGLIQFSFNDEPWELAKDILEQYYRK